MTQIATQLVTSILAGPRGVGARALGGAYTQDCQQDLNDTDSFQQAIILLSGTTDALNPHVPGNYIIKTGSADAITLPLPTAGLDDNLCINIWSDTLFAHTVTLPSTGYANGAAVLKTIGTFAAFRGAGMTLRAFNGTWQVVGNSSVSFT